MGAQGRRQPSTRSLPHLIFRLEMLKTVALLSVLCMAAADGPDCSKAACGKVCTCTESKCADQADKCLADPHCAALQDCVMGCVCGDHTCTLGCAMKNPLAAATALPLFSCTKNNCWGVTV